MIFSISTYLRQPLFACFLCVSFIAQAQSGNDSFNYYKQKIDDLLTEGSIDSDNYLIDKMQKTIAYPKSMMDTYFLKTRKMEVNYYYDLGKLGLIDAKKNLDWALHHGNADIVMDAYNFTGLFQFMLGKWNESIESYKKGLTFLNHISSLPYPVSESYHLQNNLAESYLKKGLPDSALKYCKLALQGAIAKNDKRMMALSAYQIANVLAEKKDYASSDSLLKNAINLARENKLYDVELVCLGSFGLDKKLTAAENASYVLQGFKLIETNPSINSFYKKDFYKQALTYYTQTANYKMQSDILRKLAIIEDKKKAKELDYLISQYDEVITENEKRIALEKSNLQKSKEVQRLIIITALVSILVLLAVLIIFFLRIKRKEAILNIRSAISRDLHDDLGSSLSSLNIYSNLLNNATVLPQEKQHDVTQKIATITKDLMNNLHDIIWSLDKNKQQTSLEDLLKSYAMNMLTNKNIQVFISIKPPVETSLTSPKARKNILMTIKEIMNNCSKYSFAKNFYLNIYLHKNTLHILAKDDGIGFETKNANTGNGLKNIQRRMKEINGTAQIQSLKNEGTEVQLLIPLQSIRMKEYFLKPLFMKKKTT